MRVALHIGVEKTGTSSIQRFFRTNRDALKRSKVLYSEVAGKENHMALAAAAQSDEKVDDLRMIYGLDTPEKVCAFRASLPRRLAEEARDSGCSTVVFSGEHCSSRLVTPNEVRSLVAILGEISSDITVVVYLRRQDEFLCSTYSTDVKSGSTAPFTLPPDSADRRRYDYYDLLRRWSLAFGRENIVCRIYDTARLIKGDVVDDFAQTAGLKLDPALERPGRANESLDVSTLEFLRLVNPFLPRFENSRPNRIRGNLVQLLEAMSDGPAPILPVPQMKAFMARFAESNGKVADEYFGARAEIGDPLFGEAPASRPRSEMRSISAETAAAFAARLWRKKQQQVLNQSGRLARLQGEKSNGGSGPPIASRGV